MKLKQQETIEKIEKPINIPKVPPTELTSPRKSNKTYSSNTFVSYGGLK